MRIIENPNPLPTTEHVCAKCQCKFEYTEQDVIKHHDSDANGRIGGTHYYCYQESVNCPNCGETYIIKSKSGYTSSCITHQMDDEEIASKFKQLLGTEDEK
jgi:DNA-directed RNA polymerase subunit RPC12/RpoP